MLTNHQQSALDIKSNIALTANAGSGKTFVLARRFLEIAVTGDIPVRKIAAITFTEKAASELYKKIADQVEKIIISTGNPELIEKLKKIRRSLVSANISTIHSFCINLLREFPVEAELDANFTPVDTIISDELIELSADEVIKAALLSDKDSPKIKSLIRLFSSRNIFSAELVNLVRNRRNIFLLKDRLYNKSADEIAAALFNSFIDIAGGYLDKKLPVFISELREFIKKVEISDPGNKSLPEIIHLCNEIERNNDPKEIIKTLSQLYEVICTKDGKIRKCIVRRFKVGSYEQSGIAEFLSDAGNFFYNDDHNDVEKELARISKALIYFFDKTIEKYNEKKQSKGYIDFEDILLFTKRLLEKEDVRQSISNKFDYIMIDEYQDTNEIQYEIFLPVLDYLKRGNLFVVGDEKQSIYMFRDAELEVFDKTKKLISRNKSGKLLVLPDSFRMVPDICLFTNHIFKKLFSNPDILFNEVAHSELVCARQEYSDSEIEFLIEDGKTSEADLVSEKILELIEQKGIRWNRIAILSRKRKSFDELEESFINHNIPYLILGGRNFYQRQSIYDIYNYFAFLLDTNNDGALAGILRSPFFNLSDSKLYEISMAPGFTFYQKLLSFNDDEIFPVKEKLKEMTLLAKNKPAPELLRKILGDSDFLACLSAKKNGIQESANIRKLIKVTINFYSRGLVTLYDYVNFLKTNIEQVEDESQAIIADESNTVKIMTIHQAKGLEFPAVFIFKAGETARKSLVRQKSIVINKELGLLTKVPLNENYYEDYLSAPVVNLNNFISLKKDIAELKRLLYVAITRAMDYLYITSIKKDSYPDDSFMGLLSKVFVFEGDSLIINDKLRLLKQKDGKFELSSHQKSLHIPIRNSLAPRIHSDAEKIHEEKTLLVNKIQDSLKDETISATKFSVYSACPLKYKFTYVDGLLPVINSEFIEVEDDDKDENIITGRSGIKGRIIHKILQKGEEIKDREIIRKLIIKEDDSVSGKAAGDLACEIETDLKTFFDSDTYTGIKIPSGENEYEVYYNENDYILYGIIDRLIIKDGIITIIDYKTDDIASSKIEEKAGEYLNQLKFYSYIIWNIFNSSYRIIVKIIFIKHPEKYFELEISKNDLLETGIRIKTMIENIRNNYFEKNKSHCKKCIYSEDHINCIKRDRYE